MHVGAQRDAATRSSANVVSFVTCAAIFVGARPGIRVHDQQTTNLIQSLAVSFVAFTPGVAKASARHMTCESLLHVVPYEMRLAIR